MNTTTMTAIAIAIAAQTIHAQAPTASMTVTNASGIAVGSMCEQFHCTPHVMDVTPGDGLQIDMHGMAGQPYILFAGDPAPLCISLPWALGAITSAPPYLIVDVGLVPSGGWPSKCGLETASLMLSLPDPTPSGAQIVLQTAAWPYADLPAFSRGVLLTVK